MDAYRLIAAIERRENLHDLARFLWRTPIDQSTPTGLPHVRPTAQLTPGGRLSVLRHDSQRVDGNPDPRSQTLLECWHDITEEAAAEALRFLVRPGELLCLDNYRILHGREAYEGDTRLLRRVWAWSGHAFGAPRPDILAARPPGDMVLMHAT